MYRSATYSSPVGEITLCSDGDALRGLWIEGQKYHGGTIPEAMDVMIRWFCILFGNQFTPDDVLDHYPVDRLMHDIALALMAVQTQTTGILDEFPTKAAKTEAPAATA